LSAALFGAMTVALRFGLPSRGDAELAALVMTCLAAAVAALATALEQGAHAFDHPRELALFALAGLIAPGASQVFFTRAVRDAGPSRTSVVVGSAPLFAVAIAIPVLGEPVRAPLILGAVLIVLAGVVLASEPTRPAHFRMAGIGFAVVCTLLFSTRDNLVRHLAGDAATGSVAAATAALGVAALAMLGYAFSRRRGLFARLHGLRLPPLLLAGVSFGLSYVCLFEAYYRARVSVVSPLVATESLWGVLFSAPPRRHGGRRPTTSLRRRTRRQRRRPHRSLPLACRVPQDLPHSNRGGVETVEN
jgi:drug/metabolite transporter (DMT)-like permease